MTVSLTKKIGIVGIVPFMGFLLSVGFHCSNFWSESRLVTGVRIYSEYSLASSRLVTELQRERGKTNLFLNGGTSFEFLIEQRQASDRVAKEFTKNRFGYGLDQVPRTILPKVTDLRHHIDSKLADASEARIAYTAIITNLLERSARVSKGSYDPLTSTLQGYAMLEAAKEEMGRLRAIASGIIAANRPLSDQQLNELISLKAVIHSHLHSPILPLVLEPSELQAISLIHTSTAWQEVDRVFGQVIATARHGDFGVDPKAFFFTISVAIDNLGNHIESGLKRVTDTAIKREFDAKLSLVLFAVATIGTTLFVGTLMLLLTRSTANLIFRQRELEGQLLQAQKLESIGQLAAGVAHEINTPIQFIGDNTRFVLSEIQNILPILSSLDRALDVYIGAESSSPNEVLAQIGPKLKQIEIDYLQTELPRALEQSIQGIQQVAEIVRSLKDFAHPAQREMSLVNVNEIISTVITVCRSEWKDVADLETLFDENIPRVPAFVGELQQTLLNLIVNAAQAITEVQQSSSPEKGKITISTQMCSDTVKIWIADTGAGIPDSIRAKVFDPFFTTKPIGKGTGQGLSMAYSSIVKRHHGNITFDSTLGKGATFVLTLPLSQQLKLSEVPQPLSCTEDP